MAKHRGQDDGDRDDEPQPGDGEEGPRKPGGRTIGRWKVQAHKDLPEASDEQIAARIRKIAESEGFADYDCSAAQVAEWREKDARRPAALPTPDEEGYGIVVLRQLVHLLGKEGTKRLIDSL
jgi:hypothetical protein